MKKIISFFTIICFSVSVVTAQNSIEKKSTAAKNVSILKKEFVIQNLNNISHKIWVYLPPNYTKTSKKFPVIYMHDAQNLFDNATSYIGEWQVDETLNKLFEKTGKGFIVVGIENGGNERINEYTPWKNKKYGGGKGEIYIDFIVHTLKPYIDANYRTKKQAKQTALIGSSLGGLISYYGGLKYSNIFGKIGALSTSFWFSNKVIDFTKKFGNTSKIKLYLYVGGKEGESMDSDTKNMKNLLIATGFPVNNLKIGINPNGKHNEATWKNEFLKIISWLYKIH
ncbi:MAG: alpha/beta hydrolase-fold protein [Lutibacter sp.]|uniref:alpha/beta hydrolase n=1 Tax=Lutibacter sp. TaxID=1925666 RepID=UPI00299E8340|nr:alpha/beta hydrolase-fold protein [Lutibacter sp.]MDX1829692.1 alpha/beta hydrolase-fold protein [Lutibacter sp.]